MSELKGRGAAWTDERGTSEEGRRHPKAPWKRAGKQSAPEASGKQSAPEASGKRSRSAAAVSWLREAALLPVLAVLIIVGSVLNSHFLTVSNLTGLGQQISSLGVVVVGESLILLIGGMDLSLEATYGLAPMVAAWLIVPIAAFGNGMMLNPFLGILILLAVGVAVGFVNGLLIVKGRLNGFIVTLAMTILLAGIQEGIVKGQSPFDLPNEFSYLGAAYIGKIPVSLIVTAVIFVVTGLFLRYHRTGRAIYAIGGNRAAARAAGIKVNRVRIGVYVAGSVLAAIGGWMEAGRVSSVASTQGYGEGIIFAVFAAAVIGGVSLQGGRGNMVGAASGVVLLGVVQNILDLENAPNYWIDAIDGAVILVALILARVIGGEASAE
jgi:simple sugar transport system permease protein